MKKLILPVLLIGLVISTVNATETMSKSTSESKDSQTHLQQAPAEAIPVQEVTSVTTHPVAESKTSRPTTQKTVRVYQEPFMPLSLRTR